VRHKSRATESTHRIPYYRAPFYFAPEYLATAGLWQSAFRSLAKKILLQNDSAGRVIEADNYSMMVSWGALELMIDARLGKFDIWENDGQKDDDPSSEYWEGLETIPFLFVEAIRAATIPKRLVTRISDQIIPFAEAVQHEMSANFERALRDNFAEIQAQSNSPLPEVPFMRIEPESRRYFPLDFTKRELTLSGADELDEPVGPNGEKLYAYGVVALQPPAKAKASRAKAVDSPKTDGRVKNDWKDIDQIILEEYVHIRLKPSRTKTELLAAVEMRMGVKAPSRSDFYERVTELIPDFYNPLRSKAFRQSGKS
jgi:hypothetical protein